MEKNDYIIRSCSSGDSRKKNIELTNKSREIVSLLKKNFDKVAHRVVDDISKEEYESFKSILNKMERNIDDLC